MLLFGAAVASVRERKGPFAMLQKIKGYHLMAGSLGLLGKYAQMGWDFAQRSRFKYPAEPPGPDPLKQLGNIVLDWMEQKQLTPNDVDEGPKKNVERLPGDKADGSAS
jgi:3-polyprenyl-4-hydroxybenzoate decarboxylase